MVDDDDAATAPTVNIAGKFVVDNSASSAAKTESIPRLPPPPSLASDATVVAHGAPRDSRDLGRPLHDGERYTLGEQIGRGGMGEVLGAYDEQIGRDVAVKRILASAPGADELARFLREARVQGRLQHPAIVPVHDLGIDPTGRPYFVMKRLAGESLHDALGRLAADDITTRRRLLRAFVDVCMAVALAHDREIVHRDLKPANIMLGDFNEVYVLDWGVARILTESPADPTNPGAAHADLDSGMTHAGAILGTPTYMAPEQLAGEPATPAADIYALGCVLYEIITTTQLHARTRTAVSTPDARPSSRRPDAPPELDTVCVRATSMDPAQRYLTARALAEAVQAYLDGDRDLAVRRELAATHLAIAHAARERAGATFTDGGAEAARAEAMREAGRALALDPESAGAALLVTQLMLEPPARTPPEVERRLEHLDTEAARFQGRLSALALLGYLAFIPFMLWTGIKQPSIIAAFAALVVAGGVQTYLLARGTRIPAAGIYLNAVVNACVIAMVSRMVGPFVIAPTLVATTLMAYAVHPKLGRIRIVSAIIGAGVAIPWLLEIAGVLAPTYSFDRGDLVIHSNAIAFTTIPFQVAMALLLVAVLVVVALLARSLAMRQREVTRKVELQAWQLRQLVPASSSAAASSTSLASAPEPPASA